MIKAKTSKLDQKGDSGIDEISSEADVSIVKAKAKVISRVVLIHFMIRILSKVSKYSFVHNKI